MSPTVMPSSRSDQMVDENDGVERKPVDPPPIIQLKIREENSYLAQ
jgi:hypothetical protein